MTLSCCVVIPSPDICSLFTPAMVACILVCSSPLKTAVPPRVRSMKRGRFPCVFLSIKNIFFFVKNLIDLQSLKFSYGIFIYALVLLTILLFPSSPLSVFQEDCLSRLRPGSPSAFLSPPCPSISSSRTLSGSLATTHTVVHKPFQGI